MAFPDHACTFSVRPPSPHPYPYPACALMLGWRGQGEVRRVGGRSLARAGDFPQPRCEFNCSPKPMKMRCSSASSLSTPQRATTYRCQWNWPRRRGRRTPLREGPAQQLSTPVFPAPLSTHMALIPMRGVMCAASRRNIDEIAPAPLTAKLVAQVAMEQVSRTADVTAQSLLCQSSPATGLIGRRPCARNSCCIDQRPVAPFPKITTMLRHTPRRAAQHRLSDRLGP